MKIDGFKLPAGHLAGVRALMREYREYSPSFNATGGCIDMAHSSPPSPPSPGREPIYLTTGSPRFTPFGAIREYQAVAIRNYSPVHYRHTRGSINATIISEFMKTYGFTYPECKLELENTVVGNGVTQLFHAAINGPVGKKDKILFPIPTYGFFARNPQLDEENVRVIPLSPDNKFYLTPEQLDEALKVVSQEAGDNKVWLVMINPHNPSGAVLTQEEIDALGQVILKYPNVNILNDMVYRFIEYDENKQAGSFSAIPELFDRTITMHGLSKAYSLAGLRIAVAIGPEHLINPMNEYLGYNTEFINIDAQMALEGAYMLQSIGNPSMPALARNNLATVIQGKKRALSIARSITDPAYQTAEEAEKEKMIVFELAKELNLPSYLQDAASHYRSNWLTLMDFMGYVNQVRMGEAGTARDLALGVLPPPYPDFSKVEKLPQIQELGLAESGFFQQFDFSPFIGKYHGTRHIKNGWDLAKAFMDRGVSLLPGELYLYPGVETAMRVSFSLSNNAVYNGIARIQRTLTELTTTPNHSLRLAENFRE